MGEERQPCAGGNTCCNRPLFDRTLFTCDERVELRRRVRELEAEVCRLKADDWQVGRVLAWLTNPDRKPANTAFTQGVERTVAYHVEDLIRDNARLRQLLGES